MGTPKTIKTDNGPRYTVKNLEQIKHGLESWRGYWNTIPPSLVFAIDV